MACAHLAGQRSLPSSSRLCRAQAHRPVAVVRATVSRVPGTELVQDIMNKERLIFTCRPEDSVDKALQVLVDNCVSGLPVVDEQNRVVGVVSDFDLLALDVGGVPESRGPLFPPTDETWQAFKAVKSMLAKGTGKKVKDVMTANPLCVKADDNINHATSLLLQKRIRRLPVVDESGKLVGIISRSNIIRSALAMRKALQEASASN